MKTIDGYGMLRSVQTHNIYLLVLNIFYFSFKVLINFWCLFAASSAGKARLWRLDTKEVEREYIGHQKAITALAFRD